MPGYVGDVAVAYDRSMPSSKRDWLSTGVDEQLNFKH